jgi:streptomycin 3"-adenylyltransferase
VSALGSTFEAGSPVPAYLEEVRRIHREIFGSDLAGLYLHGSAVQNDFRPGLSDLDILGVVSGAVTPEACKQLTSRLSYENLPVPAFGLELILCLADAVREPVEAMPFEFALSTGREWGLEVEQRGTTSDILVHMLLCRQAGLVLAGAPARDILAPISENLLRAGLMGEMLWHRNDLARRPSDQQVANAVLNAARSLYAAEMGEIVSKSQGAKWWLANNPEDRAVSDALAFRERRCRAAPSLQFAQDFVEEAIARTKLDRS